MKKEDWYIWLKRRWDFGGIYQGYFQMWPGIITMLLLLKATLFVYILCVIAFLIFRFGMGIFHVKKIWEKEQRANTEDNPIHMNIHKQVEEINKKLDELLKEKK